MPRTARFYRLDADGRYVEVQPVDGVFCSEVVPGFWLRVDWLWQDPLPTGPAVLRELGVL